MRNLRAFPLILVFACNCPWSLGRGGFVVATPSPATPPPRTTLEAQPPHPTSTELPATPTIAFADASQETQPPPSPAIYRAGEITMSDSFISDLDEGEALATSETADLWFYFGLVLGEPDLTPINGALLLLWPSGTPTGSECGQASLTSDPIPGSSLRVGTWFCYRTNAGRVGMLVIEERTLSSIRLSFTTWR